MVNKLKKILEPPKSPFDKDKEKPVAVTQAPETPQATQIIRDENGVPRGIKNPDGSVNIMNNPQDVMDLANIKAGQAQAFAAPVGIAEAADVNKQKELQAQQAELISKELPANRSLTPEDRGIAAKIPGVGGSIATIQNVLYDTIKKTPILNKVLAAEGTLDPEILRTAAATQIEKEIYEEGVTASEKFGALVESIPVVGNLVKKYVKDLETPSGNIDTIMRNIKVERGRATKYETWARTGAMDPNTAFRQIEDIELNIQRLESRIKLLTNYSPELRFNADEVNRMESEILRTREILLESKLRA